MRTLLLRLAAPMQAWGLESKFEDRQTEREPTKSGVIGLVASAMGIRRDDADALQRLNALTFGVRVEQEGVLLRDYHIAKSREWDARAKAMKEKHTYQTERFYLCDAVFLAALEGDDALIAEVEEALRHPAFPLFLGRRSCPPMPPISLGSRALPLREALTQEPWQAAEWYQQRWRQRHPEEAPSLRWRADAVPGETATAFRRDMAVSFNPTRREYTFRRASEGKAELPKQAVSTAHDAMAEVIACT